MSHSGCVVYGVGSPYVHEVDEILGRCGLPVTGFVANISDGYRPAGLSPLVDAASMPEAWLELAVVLPLTTPGYRQTLEEETVSRGFRLFPAVVDPTTVVASTVVVGQGTVVNGGGTVGAHARLGRFVSVNRSASVGHDSVLEDFVTLGPASVLCGACRLGPGAFIGAGAVLNPGVAVGANAVVGSGAVVLRDVPPHAVCVGNPARIVRQGTPGYNGVSVRTAG